MVLGLVGAGEDRFLKSIEKSTNTIFRHRRISWDLYGAIIPETDCK